MRDDGQKINGMNAEFAGKPLSEVIQEVEKQYICQALNAAAGNKAEAARMAGLTYQTFIRKLASLNLKVIYCAE